MTSDAHNLLAAPVRLAALPPLSLYVHVPWCVRKCPYCDFNSHESRGEPPWREYLDALIADLDQTLPRVWGRRLATVFFGGGTPSLMPPELVDALLAAVRARLLLAPDAEVTLEANPGTVDRSRFREFRDAGVNRLSLGIQSFNAQHLKALGRIHDDHEARHAAQVARECFDNFNLDLMYGLPQQSVAQARADLDVALACAPTHLSAYHLTLEPNTPFYKAPPPLPDDDTAASMQEAVEGTLAAQGFTHYETSAFALCDAQCRHNLNYWMFGDYIGIGAGAHGKLSFPERVTRETRYRQPREYMARALAGGAMQASREVPSADLGFEFMMNALRLTDGFETRLFAERSGVPLTNVLRALDAAERQQLIVRDHQRIAPTLRGQRFLNTLLQLFLPDVDSGKISTIG